jgi:hypothetical protein
MKLSRLTTAIRGVQAAKAGQIDLVIMITPSMEP